MSSRVLSTEQAKSSISKMQSIINGGFADQISQLDAEGQTLSDPNVWDDALPIFDARAQRAYRIHWQV